MIAGEGPASAPSPGRCSTQAWKAMSASSAISIAKQQLADATRPPLCLCSPRAPRPRAWCCSKRWRRAARWYRPAFWAQLDPTARLRAALAPENPTAFLRRLVDLYLLDDPPQAARCGATAQTYARRWASHLMSWLNARVLRGTVRCR